MRLNTEQIKEILPHREPFLFIDSVDELRVGERCVARKTFGAGEYFFRGHFPDYPVVPGVIILEALAQAGAVAVLAMPENKGRLAFFASASNVKFKKQVRPDDELVLDTTLTKLRSRSGLGHACATLGGEVACEADIMFVLGDDKGEN